MIQTYMDCVLCTYYVQSYALKSNSKVIALPFSHPIPFELSNMIIERDCCVVDPTHQFLPYQTFCMLLLRKQIFKVDTTCLLLVNLRANYVDHCQYPYFRHKPLCSAAYRKDSCAGEVFHTNIRLCTLQLTCENNIEMGLCMLCLCYLYTSTCLLALYIIMALPSLFFYLISISSKLLVV